MKPGEKAVSEKTHLGEFELIARYFKPLATGLPGSLNLTDDAAVLDIPDGRQLVVTHDALVAGVHFLTEDTAADVAAKALRVNVSDLAAMGATPLAYTLTLALPTSGIDTDWLAAFSESLAEDQKTYGIALAGGDTVSTPGPLSVTVCALGTVAAGQALTRSGARPGDSVFVTGTIGDAALGLRVLQGGLQTLPSEHRAALVDRYRRPQPRVAAASRFVGLVHAALDVSDGLIGDLDHICAESGVEAMIDASRIPLSDAARAALETDASLLERVLTGGDDYEILFTAPPEARDALAAIGAEEGLSITEIGTIREAGGDKDRARVVVRGAGGRAMTTSATGFRHF